MSERSSRVHAGAVCTREPQRAGACTRARTHLHVTHLLHLCIYKPVCFCVCACARVYVFGQKFKEIPQTLRTKPRNVYS